MKKLLVIAALSLALVGCATKPQPPMVVTVTKVEVVMPDPRLFNCPIYNSFPAYKTLTDVQVARTLARLYKNNQVCYNSIMALQKFLRDAKVRAER